MMTSDCVDEQGAALTEEGDRQCVVEDHCLSPQIFFVPKQKNPHSVFPAVFEKEACVSHT